MTPMKIKTRLYFNDGSTLAIAGTFGEIVKNLSHGKGIDHVLIALDQDGREHLIPWKSITHIENCYNRYDQLEEHVGEKSEVGVAADFVQNVPHSWGFPQTDSVKLVDEWLRGCQDRFPADLQYLYKRIAYTLLAYWYNTADVPKMDETMEAMDKVADEIRRKQWKSIADYYEEPKETRQVDVKEMMDFLKERQAMIERGQQ